jgi:hypothetical protein
MMNVWPFPPQRELKERTEWKTDVIRCRAAEQRICLRPVPRTTIDLDFQFLPGEIEAATDMARSWGADEFLLPFWQDLAKVGMVASGAQTIYFDTSGKRFQAGGYAFIMGSDGKYEVVQITTVNPTSIELADPYVVLGFAGAIVAPAYPARFKKPLGFRKYAADYFTGSAEFILVGDQGVAGANPFPTFKNAYVMTDRPLVTGSSNESQTREFSGFDNIAGPLFYSKSYTYAVGTFNMTWSFDTDAQLQVFRQWMQVVKGKQGSFYAPRWTRDFVPSQPILAADTTITVSANGFRKNAYTGPVCLVKTTGQLLFLEIDSVLNTGGGEEQLQLTAAVGEDLALADIEMITRMPRVRFNSDTVEYAYNTGGSVDVRLPVMEVPE